MVFNSPKRRFFAEKVDPKKDRLIDEKLAAAIQDAVWTVVSKHPLSGVRRASSRERQSAENMSVLARSGEKPETSRSTSSPLNYLDINKSKLSEVVIEAQFQSSLTRHETIGDHQKHEPLVTRGSSIV